MEPIPSSPIKSYPPHGPLQQYRFSEATTFRCFRCGEVKKAKLITTFAGDWNRKLCNGCYGRLLSLYEIKLSSDPEGIKIGKLTESLLQLASADQKLESERLFKASDNRAEELSAEALKFIATAEHVASQLESTVHLEWSPAVIGLCKAVEVEIIHRILEPLSQIASLQNLDDDVKDKDIGRVAAFCSKLGRTPPELGVFSYFLKTVIHSQQRRQTSPLILSFLSLAGNWIDSVWILDTNGLHNSLTILIRSYRNRAAHIDELSQAEYEACRELVLGSNGLIWRLVLSTKSPK